MFADERDERLSRTRQAAIAAVNQAQFAPDVDAFHGKQFHFTSPSSFAEAM